MSQQPPGPYPAYPQYPGGAAAAAPRPPAPQTVLRAHYCILAGAVLTLVGVLVTLTQTDTIRSVLATDDPTASQATLDTLRTATVAIACVFGAIEVGLWIWMAFATKAGQGWARILSTVFFGLNATGVVIGTLAYLASSSGSSSTGTTFASSDTTLGQVVSWLEFLAGLAAIILLWNKESSAYFKPPVAYYPGPYGYPGPGMPQGPVPYTYPVMPQQPQGGPPRDPWGTPPQG